METFAPDACDDACSICLEPFSAENPAMVTHCKHEYHLQCILEWSQRSRECPICSQALVLRDPTSQELLATMEVKSGGRTRRRPFEIPVFTRIPVEVPSVMEYMDVEEHTGNSRRERPHQPVTGDHPQLLIFANSYDTDLQQRYTALRNENEVTGSSTSLPGDSPHTPRSPIIIDEVPVGSLSPSSEILGFDIADNRNSPFSPRVLSGKAFPDSPRRSRQSEILSFSESVKSKIAAASSRYKESISKNTRSFKEKLLARNNSVKELSKEVQREVTAGIAGVARLMERLDPTSKKSRGINSVSCGTEGTSALTHYDKFEGEASVTQAPNGCTGKRASVTSSDPSDVVTDSLFLSSEIIAIAQD